MALVAEGKTLWSVKECAEELGISQRTLHTITTPRGSLPCVKIGVRVMYRPESIKLWLKEQEIAAVNENSEKRKNDFILESNI